MHLASNLQRYSDLIDDVTSVLETLVTTERDVQARNGRWYLMRIQPYRTTENMIEGAVITFVDITSQKKMQAELDQSRQLNMEGIFDAALVVNGGGKVIHCNSEALKFLGYDLAEIQEAGLADLVETDDYRKLREAIDRAHGGEKPTVQLTLRKKGGERFPARVRLRTIEGGEGKAVLVVLQDVRQLGGDGTGS